MRNDSVSNMQHCIKRIACKMGIWATCWLVPTYAGAAATLWHQAGEVGVRLGFLTIGPYYRFTERLEGNITAGIIPILPLPIARPNFCVQILYDAWGLGKNFYVGPEASCRVITGPSPNWRFIFFRGKVTMVLACLWRKGKRCAVRLHAGAGPGVYTDHVSRKGSGSRKELFFSWVEIEAGISLRVGLYKKE